MDVVQAKSDVELCCHALPLNSRWHIETCESQKPALLCPAWAALPTSQCAPGLTVCAVHSLWLPLLAVSYVTSVTCLWESLPTLTLEVCTVLSLWLPLCPISYVTSVTSVEVTSNTYVTGSTIPSFQLPLSPMSYFRLMYVDFRSLCVVGLVLIPYVPFWIRATRLNCAKHWMFLHLLLLMLNFFVLVWKRWINLVRNRDGWQDLANAAVNLRVP